MEIREHLNGDDFTRALLGESDRRLTEHFEQCPSCLARYKRESQGFSDFGKLAREASTRSEAFWTRQAARIAEQAHSSESGQFAVRFQPAWVAIAVVILLGFLLLLGPSKPSEPQYAQSSDDYELLVDVEHTVHSALPAALAPAALLAEEIERNSRPAARSHTYKENPYAN
jgi:hypothetical protein